MRANGWVIFLNAAGLALLATSTQASGLSFASDPSRFYYNDVNGRRSSAPIIHRYSHRIVHPGGQLDSRIDPRLRQAATIAQERSNARSKSRCWQYVKQALVASGVIKSYPKTAYAAEAGDELVRSYGFTRLSVTDPYRAPLGAVIVYGDRNRGHVEIRTKNGFASDYHSNNACFYRVVAIYGKLTQ